MMLPVNIRRVGPISFELVHRVRDLLLETEWAKPIHDRPQPSFRESRTIVYYQPFLKLDPIPDAVRACIQTIDAYYPDAAMFRAEASYIGPGKRVFAHRDGYRYSQVCHRVHVPITTNPQAWLQFGDEEYHTPIGNVYELNNMVEHGVSNDGPTDRIHLIVDMIPTDVLLRNKDALRAMFYPLTGSDY